MKCQLVDAHCHIDLMANPSQVAEEIERQNLLVIGVTNAPSVFYFTKALSLKYRGIYPAVGLHPELVATHFHEAGALSAQVRVERFVGEIGLDYTTTDDSHRGLQRKVLEAVVGVCREVGDRVLSIHSRRAAADTIAIIGEAFPGYAILHWFSGSKADLRRAVDAGFYFSVNGAMVASEKGKKLIDALPPDRVITESDSPFIRLKGQPATPSSVSSVVRALSEAWRCEYDEAQVTICNNFRRIAPR